jgi:3-oxoacyl-[acyl-carrier-protein] synthase II
MSQGESIVITGVGLVTCLGLTAGDTWRGVCERRAGFGSMPALESPLPPGRTGAQAPDLPADFFPDGPREARYLRWAITDAIAASAGAPVKLPRPERIGVVMGTTLHGMRQGGVYLRTAEARVMERFLAGGTLHAALRGLPIAGPALTTCSACSSGLGAIALACTLLGAGQLDLVIAGGYDPVSEYVYAGFDSLRLVAETDTRPFARQRDGMKIGEGYAAVALRREADAGGPILARVLGSGETSDSHHLTQPDPTGDGARRAAAAALAMAGLPSQAVGLVSAHATGTPNNDAAEFAAISAVMGERQVPVVAFKSHVGHTLGAAGATELILSIMALREQTFPPTANTRAEDLEFPVRLNVGEARPQDIAATMNLSLGFGGSNAAMVCGTGLPPGAVTRDALGSGSTSNASANTKSVPAPGGGPVPLITGIGFVAPGLVGNEALAQLASSPRDLSPAHLADEAIAHLLNARRVRRMSEYVKATLAATSVAFQHAGITDIPAFAASAGAILGTCLGSSGFCESYYRPITKEGLAAANPALFAEGVPNAAAAQLSLMFGVKGPCQTLIGSRTAGADALWLAAMRIASGEWDRAIVSAGEELHETAVEIYKALGLAPALSTGAITLILESEQAAKARGARPLAAIDPQISGAVRADSPARLISRAAALLAQTRAATVVPSGNGTWLDRIERAATRRGLPEAALRTLAIPDLQSGHPLAALAATLLTGPVDSVALLATDYSCTASALHIRPIRT